MKKRIQTYMQQIDFLLKSNESSTNWEKLLDEHLIQITFSQHERLIHLLVTMLVAILLLLSVGIALIAGYPYMLLASAGLFFLLVPYIFHYFFLENAVQKLYEQYDAIWKKYQEFLK
ncbi:MAG: hypothetical protein ACI4HI_10945 [Lachnospiraceae bacterium]